MEDAEKDWFYGILINGEMIKRSAISELQNIPHIVYYVLAKYNYTYRGPSNTTRWYHYIPIDKNGNPLTIRIGNFEVAIIDKDDGKTNFFGRKVQIYDIRKDKLYPYLSMHYGVTFISQELVPLLNKLNELGSWEAYELSLEVERLRAEIRQLKEQYDLQ